jgi:glutamine amidotransferase
MTKIGIIDYGVGNIRSISNALNKLNCKSILVDTEKDIMNCDGIILPGVGAFQHGMDRLKSKKLDEILKKYVDKSRPFLGICLGMQMLFEKSNEFGESNGLGFIEGDVKKFTIQKDIKIPHISWTEINADDHNSWKNTILENIDINSDMYHVHSYYAKPKDSDNILSFSMYNDFKYCSTVQKNNIYGCQYHPEKSGEEGLKILKNFIDLT